MTYRNKSILQAAKDCPQCFGCDNPNDGTVSACHSNQLRDGKGTGHKASDYRIAYMDQTCHFRVDNGKDLTREEKIALWEKAHRASIGWLFESGRVKV